MGSFYDTLDSEDYYFKVGIINNYANLQFKDEYLGKLVINKITTINYDTVIDIDVYIMDIDEAGFSLYTVRDNYLVKVYGIIIMMTHSIKK